MITLEIPESNRLLYLPEDLKECDSRQYAEASHLIYRYRKEEITYEDFRIEMIYKLLELQKGKRKLSEEEEQEMCANIYRLSTSIDSFFEEDEDGKITIKQYYIDNHSKVISDAFKTWYGPEDGFDDITWGQYIDALEIYSLLEQDFNEAHLYRLMAVFYKENKNKAYDAKKTAKTANHLKHVYFGRVYGFFLLFASFQKYLFSAQVFVQGKWLDLSILFEEEGSKKEESKIPGIGMKAVAHRIAETGIYGPMQKVNKTNFWEMIIFLYDIRKREKDRKAQEKTRKQNQ